MEDLIATVSPLPVSPCGSLFCPYGGPFIGACPPPPTKCLQAPMLELDKVLSSDSSNGHWFEADWLHSKRDALSSNRKVDGSRLTGITQTCHS